MSYSTPGLAILARTCQAALGTPNGLQVQFLVTDYGSLDAAHGAARSYQAYIGNLRNAERKRAINDAKHAKLASMRIKDSRASLSSVRLSATELTFGAFDNLSANKVTLPNGEGYGVNLVPAYSQRIHTRVVDLATGKQLRAFSYEAHVANQAMYSLMQAAETARDTKRPMVNPLTPEQEQIWAAFSYEGMKYWYDDYGLPMPDVREDAPTFAPTEPTLKVFPHDLVDEDTQAVYHDPLEDIPMDEDYDMFTGQKRVVEE